MQATDRTVYVRNSLLLHDSHTMDFGPWAQADDGSLQVGNVGKEVDDAALLALFGHCGTVSLACRS